MEAFIRWIERNCFAALVASTLVLMVALTSWSSNGRYVYAEAPVNDENVPISTDLDESKDAFWVIHESGFGFLKKWIHEDEAVYEVYVAKPLREMGALKDLCKDLKEIQSEEIENVSVYVINYGNRELVDYIVEDGAITWVRR